MPFKNVEVALRLQIAGYLAPLSAAVAQTRAAGAQIAKDLGDAPSQSLDKLGKASLIAGGSLLAGLGLAAKATLDFDKQLSDLGAVSSATGDQMGKLRQQALDAGAATAFSATQAAQAQTELAKAGVSVADILGGGLEGALALAAAGNLDLGTAATYAANAMTTFGLAGRDVGHVADVLAAGANKSAADVDQIGQALQQTGLVADQFGLTLDDTVGVLAMFAQAGLKGSDAGTSFKTMLAALTPNSAKAAETMEQLGIDMFDAQGNFIGIEAAAGQLRTGLQGLTEEQRASALETIFGSDAIRAATVLYEGGAEGVSKWVTAVNDTGFASDVAAQKMDNLAGDLEGLRGSLETALIQGGSQATGVLRFLTQSATDTVNAFGSLPGPIQGVAVALGAGAGGGLTLLGAAAVAVPKIRELQVALRSMGSAGSFAANSITIAGKATLLATPLVIGAMIAWADYARTKAEAAARTDELVQAMADERDGLKDATAAASAKALADSKIGTVLRENAADYDVLTDGLREQGDAIEALDDEILTIVQGYRSAGDVLDRAGVKSSAFTDELVRLIDHSDLSAGEIKNLINALDGESDRLADAEVKSRDLAKANREVGDSATEGATGTETMAGGIDLLGGSADDAEKKIAAFREEIDRILGSALGFEEASDNLELAIIEAGEHFAAQAENLGAPGLALDGNSQAALENREVLRGLVEQSADVLKAGQEQGMSVEALTMIREAEKQKLRDLAGQYGLNQEVVEGYIGILDGIPIAKATEVTAPGTVMSQDQVANLKRKYDELPGSKETTVQAHDRASGLMQRLTDWVIGDKAFTVTANYTTRGNLTAQEIAAFNASRRWGGIDLFARRGRVVEAHMVTQPTVMYGERATRGEAYIPRDGDPARSRAILQEAAGWLDMDVVPRVGRLDPGNYGMPQGGWGRSAEPTIINVTSVVQVAEDLGPMARARTEVIARRAALDAVRQASDVGL